MRDPKLIDEAITALTADLAQFKGDVNDWLNGLSDRTSDAVHRIQEIELSDTPWSPASPLCNGVAVLPGQTFTNTIITQADIDRHSAERAGSFNARCPVCRAKHGLHLAVDDAPEGVADGWQIPPQPDRQSPLSIGDPVVIHLPMGGLIAGTVTAFVLDGDRVTVDCGKREGVHTVGAGDVLKGKREWIR